MRLAPALLALALVTSPALADEPPRPELPDALKGFAGELAGIVTKKFENSFLLRVTAVPSTWKHSTAREPQAAVGRTLLVNLQVEQHEGRWRCVPAQTEWLRRCVTVNEDYRVDVRNDEGARLHLMELNERQREALRRAQAGGEAGRAEGGNEAEARAREERAARERREAEERRAAEERAARERREAAPAASPPVGDARPPIPEGARGFSGRLVGIVVRSGEAALLLLVREAAPGDRNQAADASALAWRAVRIEVGASAGAGAGRYLAGLRPGQEVRVSVLHVEGDRLHLVEVPK